MAPRLGIYLQLSLKARSRVSEMCGCLTETHGRLFFTASLQGESETRVLKSLVSILLLMAKNIHNLILKIKDSVKLKHINQYK